MSNKNSKILLPIKGTPLKSLSFEFKKLGDLLFHEGPLLSHLVNQYDEDFYIQWCSSDEHFNRWLLYKTNYSLLHQYFNGELTDRDLLMKTPDGFAYIIDIDHGVEWKNIWVVALEDIPANYLPSHTVTYDAEDFEPYAEKLRSYLDYHFARQKKLYNLPEPSVDMAAEPTPPSYQKKKQP